MLNWSAGFCLLTSCLPRQYHFVKESKSWAKAQSFCRDSYTDLATVDNMMDMSSLLDSVKDTYNGSVWIGLIDDPKSNWRWSLDNLQAYKEGERDFRNWVTTLSDVFKKEPVCVLFSNGIWHLYSCDNLLVFICFDGEHHDQRYLHIRWDPHSLLGI